MNQFLLALSEGVKVHIYMFLGLLSHNPTTSQRLSLEPSPKAQQQRATLPRQHYSLHFCTLLLMLSILRFLHGWPVMYCWYRLCALRYCGWAWILWWLRGGIVAEGYCQQKYSLGCPSILAVDSESRLDRSDSSLLDSSAFSLLRYSPSKPLVLVLGDRVSNVTYES